MKAGDERDAIQRGLDTAALALEDASAAEILRDAARRFGDGLTFGTGFGVEGCVILDLLATAKLSIDIFTLDTEALFAETYELWRHLESRYGLRIRSVKAAPEVLAGEAFELWKKDPERCCELRKLVPIREAVAGKRAWISAIRREQNETRANIRAYTWDERLGLVKVNPLWRWSDRDVWRYVHERQVPYNSLHDRGYPSIGCEPCTTPVMPGEHPRAGRWRGRGSKECGLHLPVAAEQKEKSDAAG